MSLVYNRVIPIFSDKHEKHLRHNMEGISHFIKKSPYKGKLVWHLIATTSGFEKRLQYKLMGMKKKNIPAQYKKIALGNRIDKIVNLIGKLHEPNYYSEL